MLESAFRAKANSLYGLYHSLPYPFQNFLTSARGLLLAKARYSGGMTKYLRELRSHERWNSSEIAEFQRDALQKMIDRARATVAHYSQYAPLRLTSPEDLKEYPV